MFKNSQAVVKIKVFVPTYFDKFKCIAGKCPDTCCAGWEADLDDETVAKYKTLGGELRKKIENHLVTDDDGFAMFSLCQNGRCPFLNECGLCDIQAIHGEEFLSRTCTLFPRFYDNFGKIREMGLGFGCPEAARIILSDSEVFSLKFYNECTDNSEDIDENFLVELIELRTKFFTILDDESIDFKTKIKIILDCARKFQLELDEEFFNDEIQFGNFDDCLSVLKEMEYIDPERKKFVFQLKDKKISENTLKSYTGDFEKLMKYYLFRYMLKAVYDYDMLTKIKYGVFAYIIISRIYAYFDYPDFGTRVKIMYSYSKEVEYSDTNMQLLDDVLFKKFSIYDLIELV